MRHCETTALGVLLGHEGVELSEAMLFGLGSGLGFIYWHGKGMGFPFMGGRVRPFELTRKLVARLGVELEVCETTSRRKAWENIAGHLDAGRPVGLQVDSYHLEYFTSKVHFGGHIVAMCGYEGERAHLVDTEQQGGKVTASLAGLAAARAERGPMTARNRSFTVTAAQGVSVGRDRIVPAIRDCAEAFLDPPIANLGYRGIEKAAREVPRWLRLGDDPGRDLVRAAVLMEEGGTGGALFRNLYRDFLAECAVVIDDPGLRTGLGLYREAAGLWTEVAGLIAGAGERGEEACLVEAGAVLREVSRLEGDAMRALRRVRG